ncbi:hypothetical protein BH20ACT8_BH20ACT8_00970 [soil metagenome]
MERDGDERVRPEEELAALDRRFADELRAEQAAYEELAATDRLRRRDLGDVALELVHRGDKVAVTIGAATYAGVLVHAAGDLACLRTAVADVDLNLSAGPLLRVVETVRSGGSPSRRGARSFKARLREHEALSSSVELGGAALPDGLRARVAAVATDHVLALDPAGATWIVPLVGLAYVAASRG